MALKEANNPSKLVETDKKEMVSEIRTPLTLVIIYFPIYLQTF